MKERFFSIQDMDLIKKDPVLKAKYNVKDKAIKDFDEDKKKIDEGKLKPVYDFQFVWNGETGERKLFRGIDEPPNLLVNT